ncbi:hypothetical protein JAAARDRAFT_199322 [Jaapia argillacea MUCL 33604]|uniref:Uncharacterized protein n=1 Tax=Jaapia argillacea MUCL 33604 TaxID=933084 RepID=A0A067P8K8_9AGAM|nr:hypothetical protein JAAARDRAFT_199322 [Jaapia argillacea MUCL 33604]
MDSGVVENSEPSLGRGVPAVGFMIQPTARIEFCRVGSMDPIPPQRSTLSASLSVPISAVSSMPTRRRDLPGLGVLTKPHSSPQHGDIDLLSGGAVQSPSDFRASHSADPSSVLDLGLPEVLQSQPVLIPHSTAHDLRLEGGNLFGAQAGANDLNLAVNTVRDCSGIVNVTRDTISSHQCGVQFDLNPMDVEADGSPTSADNNYVPVLAPAMLSSTCPSASAAMDPQSQPCSYRRFVCSTDVIQRHRTQMWVAAVDPGACVIDLEHAAQPLRVLLSGTPDEHKGTSSWVHSIQGQLPSEPPSSSVPTSSSISSGTPEVPRSRHDVFPVSTIVDCNPAYFGHSLDEGSLMSPLTVESNRSQSRSVVPVPRNIPPLSFVSNSRVPKSGAPDGISNQMKLGYQVVSRSQPSTPIAGSTKLSSGPISVKGGSIPLRSALTLRRKDESLHHISQMVFNYVGKNSLGHTLSRGMKCSQPYYWEGYNNVAQFETWLRTLLQWMSVHHLTGDGHNHTRIDILRQYLNGQALSWFNREVNDHLVIGNNMKFQDVVGAIYKHFLCKGVKVQAKIVPVVNRFYDCCFHSSTGVVGFYNDLLLAAKWMVRRPDDKAFCGQFI